MKSTRYLVAVPAALALALAGCGGSTGTSETPAATGGSSALIGIDYDNTSIRMKLTWHDTGPDNFIFHRQYPGPLPCR